MNNLSIALKASSLRIGKLMNSSILIFPLEVRGMWASMANTWEEGDLCYAEEKYKIHIRKFNLLLILLE